MKRLEKLAISEEGFIFDPTTGESFTVNQTGIFIIKGLKDNKSPQTISQEMQGEFEVSAQNAERDLNDFTDHLRTYKLL